MAQLGYISAFDGVTLSDGSARKPQTPVGDTAIVQSKMYVLPNGTKINYNGTGDDNTTPGGVKVRHVIKSTSGGDTAITRYNAITGKKGNRGTLTKTIFGTSTTQTCTAVLTDVQVMANSLPQKNILFLDLTFECETDWA